MPSGTPAASTRRGTKTALAALRRTARRLAAEGTSAGSKAAQMREHTAATAIIGVESLLSREKAKTLLSIWACSQLLQCSLSSPRVCHQVLSGQLLAKLDYTRATRRQKLAEACDWPRASSHAFK